jgi:peptidoglycan/LPS O-acetylase OafA/YrhL
LQQVGYTEAGLGRGLRIFIHGDYAVDVFILLSGFVIHKLWHDAPEPYGVFIARRFLRLWPAYMVCLLGALAARPCLAMVIAHGPLIIQPGTAEHCEVVQQNWNFERDYFAGHLLAHLPMLHGVVPETLLPRSSVAFIGQAWSISLEWQFYLIAPLLFLMLKRGGGPAWLALSVVAGLGWLVRYSPPWNHWFPMDAFLPLKLLLFGLGIVSHEAWQTWHVAPERVAPALYGFGGLVLFFTLSIPLALWAVVLASALSSGGPLKRFLNSAPMQTLGRVSYSTYLGHMLVLWTLQPLILHFFPSMTAPQMLLALGIIGAPLILVLSLALYRWVEAPAIRFGRSHFRH